MGAISDIKNIGEIVNQFQLEVVIETGTYIGTGANHLAQFVPRVHTIELVEECFNSVKFNNSKIIPYLGHSVDILPRILEIEKNSKVLYWLDAHVPSIIHNLPQKDQVIEFPLEQELRVIKKYKNTDNDLFIIDDLRVYEDGPFTDGNWREAHLFPNKPTGIQFIYELFENTHIIKKDYFSSGFIFLIPKS